MQIAIYMEGGGNGAQSKADLRQGMDSLLNPQKQVAQQKRIRWKLVCCGGRNDAFDAFRNASVRSPDSVTVLLVDSEEPFTAPAGTDEEQARTRVRHLAERDHWAFGNLSSERVHLMVQCMEAWIIADSETLETYYGQRFALNQLPVRQNLEQESKTDIYRNLERATQRTQKGAYGKIKHASQLLTRISPDTVAQRCPHFGIFTHWLDKIIAEAP